MAKKKKEKVKYIDDGRTIADMSSISRGGRLLHSEPTLRPRSTMKEQWQTYFAAVKMMFVPMLVVICVIIVVYMLLSFLSLILF